VRIRPTCAAEPPSSNVSQTFRLLVWQCSMRCWAETLSRPVGNLTAAVVFGRAVLAAVAGAA
jgi:hypothetical protein